MEHPECAGEFDTKDPYECRCVPLYTKIALLKLKNAGRWDEAQAFFEERQQYSWDGVNKFGPGEALQWKYLTQTPQIWLPNMRARQVWPRETWASDGLQVAHMMEE